MCRGIVYHSCKSLPPSLYVIGQSIGCNRAEHQMGLVGFG